MTDLDAHAVYTDPDEPGAPQPGDLVVVVVGQDPQDTKDYPGVVLDERSALEGTLRQVVDLTDPARFGRHRWMLQGSRFYVHAVRRPTEAELATWALGGAHG